MEKENLRDAFALREVFYGRRKGRRLNITQRDVFARLYSRYLFGEGDLKALSAEGMQAQFETLQARTSCKAVRVEIGFGGGEHLHWQAKHHPDILWIGCEVFENGIASLLMHLESEPLDNLVFFPEHANYLLKKLPENALDGAYLLFADPWPKLRHQGRRFIQKDNLELLYRLLKKGSFFRVATDDPTLIHWTRRHLELCRFFETSEKTWRSPLGTPPPTRYEKKAVQAGRNPVFWQNIAR